MSRYRCIDGRLMRHDPQPDDPNLETDIGKCPECNGAGCDKNVDEGDWQDIETAPRDGTHITVGTFPCAPGCITITTAHWFDGEWALSVNALGEYSDCGVKSPTHWQPLPEPPVTP